MENPIFVHQLKGDSTNNELPVYDGLHFKIKKGCAIAIKNIIKNGYTAQAINGTTFDGGDTTIPLYSGGYNNVLRAPSDSDVEVLVDGKYDMGTIINVAHVDQYDNVLVLLDILSLNYYGDNQETEFEIDIYGIDMNNYGFGYLKNMFSFGSTGHRCAFKNFDWASENNGLSSENMPNLKRFSVTPTVAVPITAYGRLTSIEIISFVQEMPTNLTYGKIEDLCAALIANGKTTNFTIISNQEITLNGARVGYNKTVNCVYTNGQFACTIAS